MIHLLLKGAEHGLASEPRGCGPIREMIARTYDKPDHDVDGHHSTGEEVNMPTWDLSAPDNGDRVEITDLAETCGINLQLSEMVLEQIRIIEEAVVTAEQRVGLFRVG
jgi:hypothetical protein